MGILVYLLIILAVVAIHEMGHYLACRALGVPVNQFSVGMGPKLLGYQGDRTAWNLRLLPLGGYIAMDEEALTRASPWRKIVIALAGPLANLLPFLIIGAWFFGPVNLLLILSKLYWGTIAAFLSVIIGSVDYWHLLPQATSGGGFVGPVGMAHETGTAVASSGMLTTIIIMFSTFSIGLALFNLIPLPPLDGGRVVIAVVESIAGPRIASKVTTALTLLGIILVVWLILVITFHDVLNLL